MKKKILIDERALSELEDFSSAVQQEFKGAIALLGVDGRLAFPDARKISKVLFEMRVNREGSYRGLYAYVWQDHIVVLHFFQKKDQKLTLKHLTLAERRLREYA